MKDLNYEANENIGKFQARPPEMQPFCKEREKMDYFLERFERFAIANQWEEETLTIRLSVLLTGKALEFQSRLPRANSNDYRILKRGFLKYLVFAEDGYR